ncbi:hypothetical protein ACFPRL_14370 [Pseudoclavibacter helvolus]
MRWRSGSWRRWKLRGPPSGCGLWRRAAKRGVGAESRRSTVPRPARS